MILVNIDEKKINEYYLQNPSFPKYKRLLPKDIKLLKLLETNKSFSKCPYNFNFVVLPDISYNALNEFTLENYITFVITNNVTVRNNYVPLTPWILIHRLGHGISPIDFGNMENNEFNFAPISAISKIINFILFGADYTLNHRLFNINQNSNVSLELYSDIINSVFTMKSARTNRIKSTTEIGPECLAQYVITGKVLLNFVDNWNQKLLSHSIIKNVLVDIDKRCYINSMIAQCQIDINTACKISLDKSVGKAFTH